MLHFFWDTLYLSNYYPFSTVRDQMKALEGPKEKFDCFKGIVDPTESDTPQCAVVRVYVLQGGHCAVGGGQLQ